MPADNRLIRNPLPAGSTYSVGPGIELEQMKMDTGAANAVEDHKLIVEGIGVGVGFMPHYYGFGMDANRATTTNMELPQYRNVQHWQQIINNMFSIILRFVLRHNKFDAGDILIDIDFPPIIEADTFNRMQALEIGATLLPTNDVAKQHIWRMILTTLGENNVDALVEQFTEAEAAQPATPALPALPATPPLTPPPTDGPERLPLPVQANPTGVVQAAESAMEKVAAIEAMAAHLLGADWRVEVAT